MTDSSSTPSRPGTSQRQGGPSPRPRPVAAPDARPPEAPPLDARAPDAPETGDRVEASALTDRHETPTEYHETIVAPSQIAISVLIGVVLAVILVGIRTSLWPFAIVVFVALAAAGAYLAGISVTATPTYLEIGQGRGERDPRYLSNDEIVSVSSAQLTWAQVFGVGLPRADKTTRMTVRPGPTLVVELRTGEVVRVSTPDPARVIAILGRA